MPATYLRTRRELSDLCDQARAEGRVGMDTEFHRERRYFPQLALVQLAVSDRQVLVDPLQEGLDLGPLELLVCAPEVTKVLHAAAQDLEIFYLRARQLPRRIFDTQVAAAMLGIGAQISLAGLVEQVTGARLHKGESFTDWLHRPLRAQQESYALADVEHLLALHDHLDRGLRERGRQGYLAEELARFEDLAQYETPPEGLFRRVKRFRALDARGLAVLQELAIWREEEARRRDRPRRSVIADEVLLELARAAPRSERELRATRGLHPRELQRSGAQLLGVIEKGRSAPAERLPVAQRGRPVTKEAELSASFVQAFLKVYCHSIAVDPGLVASAADVENLVASHLEGSLAGQELEVLQGWRGELVGKQLLAFLQGNIALHLDPRTALPVLDPRDARDRDH